MRPVHIVASWVVYERTFKGRTGGVHVVCEQAEWDALEGESPGAHTLVKAGFTTEAEADRHARASTASLLTGPRRYR